MVFIYNERQESQFGRTIVAGEATGRMEGAPPRGQRSDDMAIAVGLRLLSVGPMLILVLLAAAISVITPNFLSPGNISNILAQTAVIAIVAMGQQLVILTRGIDLSVGANRRAGVGHRRPGVPPGQLGAAGDRGDAVRRRRGRRGQRRRLRLWAPAASLHHHARHAQHLSRPRAGVRDRPHDDARHAGRRHLHRRRLRPSAFPTPSSSSSPSPRRCSS